MERTMLIPPVPGGMIGGQRNGHFTKTFTIRHFPSYFLRNNHASLLAQRNMKVPLFIRFSSFFAFCYHFVYTTHTNYFRRNDKMRVFGQTLISIAIIMKISTLKILKSAESILLDLEGGHSCTPPYLLSFSLIGGQECPPFKPWYKVHLLTIVRICI